MYFLIINLKKGNISNPIQPDPSITELKKKF